jgi:hypothetical protein
MTNHRVVGVYPVDGVVIPDPVWVARYHVPWYQVHPGSGGSQAGTVHLHLRRDVVDTYRPPQDWVTWELFSVKGRRSRIQRRGQDVLCQPGPAPRYRIDRDPTVGELRDARCARCVVLADRYGIEWPGNIGGDQ